MNNFIGKSFVWIGGFVLLFLFVIGTDVGGFLFRIFIGLFLFLAAATLLGELGILDWGTKFKALSSKGKFLVLGAFFFFGLWLLVQYDVVNNITMNINESNIQSDNQKIRQARNDIDNILHYMEQSITGIKNLKETYATCSQTCARIDVVVNKINDCLAINKYTDSENEVLAETDNDSLFSQNEQLDV